MEDPSSTLYDVHVRPGPAGYTVSAWWALLRHGRSYGAIATSDDLFTSNVSYRRGTSRTWSRHHPDPPEVAPPDIDAFKGLDAHYVTSLTPRITAFVAGGDGASLLPFNVVARSDGAGWDIYPAPTEHGDQGYDQGDLVLADGRFLVLLTAWSSDSGPTEPGPEHHGLWVSDGENWASYAPDKPTFSPAMKPSDTVVSLQAEPGASKNAAHGLVVATTLDNLLYVSTDDAHTFIQVRAQSVDQDNSQGSSGVPKP